MGWGFSYLLYFRCIFAFISNLFRRGNVRGKEKSPPHFSGFAELFCRSRRLGGGRLLELENAERLASLQMGSVGFQEWAEDDILCYENG